MSVTKRNFLKALGLTAAGGLIPVADVLARIASRNEAIPIWIRPTPRPARGFLYPEFRTDLMLGQINLNQSRVGVALIDDSILTNIDQFSNLRELPTDAIVAMTYLTGNHVQGGVFDAGDVTFESIPAGRMIDYIVLFEATHWLDTQRGGLLMACIPAGEGLPFLSTGDPVKIVWDNGSRKIFSV